MRSIGLDIHRDFCEVAIAEGGEVRSSGRVEMRPEALELFAGSLARTDQVALEVSGNAWEVARIIRPHVARVVVVSPADTGIRSARAKTDRLDARALAKLLAAGSLRSVWVPDDNIRAMRRRLQRRRKLLVVRTKAKNEIHAALMRRLVRKPAVSDLFGKQGRRWLESLELPDEEQETVEGCLRQLDFCESETAAIEQRIATEALTSPEIRRLLTVPGVNVICAATFIAAVGEIRRFGDRRKLVGYLGLDPKVRQSGLSATARGRISKQGSASGRHAPVEASWSVVKAPGPMHSYYQRIRVRRGAQVAIVATSRKLACLFWCLLTREEDYAYAQPSLTAKKLRRLELAAGVPKRAGGAGVWSTNKAMREAERALARQAEARLRAQRRRLAAATATQKGRRRDNGARNLKSPIERGQAARQAHAPSLAL